MGIQQKLVITLPEPCNEDWEKMEPSENGRFCNRCNKNVIDFTTWSDARLYEFFARPQKDVCGWFCDEQLERPITLPPQPHSRLYRMAVALSLTLIFTAGNGHSFARQPVAFQSPVVSLPEDNVPGADSASINGIVTDVQNQPVSNAKVWLVRNNIIAREMVTDSTGRFLFAGLQFDTCVIMVRARGFEYVTLNGIKAPSYNTITLPKSTMRMKPYGRGGLPTINHDDDDVKVEPKAKGKKRKVR